MFVKQKQNAAFCTDDKDVCSCAVEVWRELPLMRCAAFAYLNKPEEAQFIIGMTSHRLNEKRAPTVAVQYIAASLNIVTPA
ncbi:TPA: hypothetical protein ACSP8C_003153 [Aeromonas veronii]